jgi:hypothetical protein
MTAPQPDDRPVYPSFEKALAAQEQQLRAYGVYSGIIHPADGKWMLRYDLTGGK